MNDWVVHQFERARGLTTLYRWGIRLIDFWRTLPTAWRHSRRGRNWQERIDQMGHDEFEKFARAADLAAETARAEIGSDVIE